MSQKIKLIALYFQTIPSCKTPSTWGEAVKVTEFTGHEIGDFMEGEKKTSQPKLSDHLARIVCTLLLSNRTPLDTVLNGALQPCDVQAGAVHFSVYSLISGHKFTQYNTKTVPENVSQLFMF